MKAGGGLSHPFVPLRPCRALALESALCTALGAAAHDYPRRHHAAANINRCGNRFSSTARTLALCCVRFTPQSIERLVLWPLRCPPARTRRGVELAVQLEDERFALWIDVLHCYAAWRGN